MKNLLLTFLILTQFLLAGNLFAKYADMDKDLPPMDMRYRECKVGMTIECQVDQCDSMCASMIAAEKEQKELQRLEETREVIKEGTREGIQESKEAAQPQ